MTLDNVIVGEYETNCYILTQNKEAIVIDPGDEYNKIIPCLEGKDIIAVLITHGHSDHIGAVNNFDESLIHNIDNLKMGYNEIGPFKFEMIYTPGHTEDSVTYYFPKENLMFTGDFLFKGTIGRTDFPTGSMHAMKNSLSKISKYPNVQILPGHGLKTTLENERQNNIYFSEI